MEGLSDNFILSGDEIDALDLFDSDETQEETPPEDKKDEGGSKEKEKDKSTTEEEVNPDDLFNPESVGSEDKEDKKGKEEETPDSNKDGSSPNSSFYYSIANALVEDGVLPDLDEEFVKGIKSPEDLAEAIDKQVEARLDETQKRINAALNADLEPDEIRQYEAVLSNLSKISEEAIRMNQKRRELKKATYIPRPY